MKKVLAVVGMLVLMSFVLSGCMPGDGSYVDNHVANFLSGIWHGWIAPFSLIRGFFNNDIRIYETYNTGWWYDLGFYIALIGGFGGISIFRKNKKNRKD